MDNFGILQDQNTLVMCLTGPSVHLRPNRIISLCCEKGLRVDVLSYPVSGELEFSQFYPIHRYTNQVFEELKRILSRHVSWILPDIYSLKDTINNYAVGVFKVGETLGRKEYSIIIVEDLKLLPLAFAIKGNAKVLFDAREYYPLQKENSLYFNIFEKPERIRLCRKYLQQCDHVMTVSNGLKDKYLDEFNVSCTVVRSTPFYKKMSAFYNSSVCMKIVYYGAAHRNRHIEKMIQIASKLCDRFTLDLYLVGNKQYIKELGSLCGNIENVVIKQPIAYESIIPTLNEYDFGFCYFEPTTFNLKYVLPNKLFEYIQARIPVMTSPSPDMREIVDTYQAGVASKEFSMPIRLSPKTSISCIMLQALSYVCAALWVLGENVISFPLPWETTG